MIFCFWVNTPFDKLPFLRHDGLRTAKPIFFISLKDRSTDWLYRQDFNYGTLKKAVESVKKALKAVVC